MKKKASRIFSVFWSLVAMGWVVVSLRYAATKTGIMGSTVLIGVAVISMILSLAYYRDSRPGPKRG